MSQGKKVDRRIKVLELHDDEATSYAALSHRWVGPTELDYEEMVDLAKMDGEERDEIRHRLGYRKILAVCQQAMGDGYQWVWVDTCCIDKRSSAELSEAINSMYRWYANSRVCYAYLHDVPDSVFPSEPNMTTYPHFGGWPEWFSRGWTLQEMIAPSNVQFFNKDWHLIGDKSVLAPTLSKVTRVPEHILREGLDGNRPCVAQIMSWAANRTTTRVEDRAYSLMGLLDVNMPMLYGEGKKAFHRLQLEIIRSSNDQSIFAWGYNSPNVRPGSILADDPSFFEDCSDMVLMDYDEFLDNLSYYDRGDDTSGAFPITNRGIHIWMPLCSYGYGIGESTVTEALLPCRSRPNATEIVSIHLSHWNFNYYRYPPASPPGCYRGYRRFSKVYLRYQDTPSYSVTFKIDDNAMSENGFTCCDVSSPKLTGNSLTVTGVASRPCVRAYSNSDVRFAVVFGQYFGRDWVDIIQNPPSVFNEDGLVSRAQELAPCMGYVTRQPQRLDCIWVYHVCLPGSTWIVRTSRIVWASSKIGIRVEVFWDSAFDRSALNAWGLLCVDVGEYFFLHTCYYYGHL